MRAAQALGISANSTLWYDLRALDTSGTTCREPAVSFLSAWTNKMHTHAGDGAAVRRLQRALNAAADAHLPITGVHEGSTAAAVKVYQGAIGMAPTGVAARDTWAELELGNR